MYKWINRFMRWLRLIYEFLFIVLLINFGICLSGMNMISLRTMAVLAGMLVVSYIAREHMTHAISLFILHAGLGVLAFLLLNNTHMSIIFVLVLLGVFIDASFYIKRGYTLKRTFDAPWDVFVVGMAVSILAAYRHYIALQKLGYISAVIMLIIFLVNLYFEGLLNYMVLNRRVSGLPVKQMVSVNSVIVTTIIFITIVTIVLADILGLPKVVYGLVMALGAILRIVLILLGFLLKMLVAFLGFQPIPQREKLNQIRDIAEEENIVSRILYFILVAAMIAFIVFILIRLCISLIKWLISKQKRDFENIENLKPKKKRRIEKIRIERKESSGALSNEQKARRIYKKKVLSFRRHFLPDSSDTAKDIEVAMLKFIDAKGFADKKTTEKDTSIKEDNKRRLTELYERVRYGNYKPDKEYLKKMKEL